LVSADNVRGRAGFRGGGAGLPPTGGLPPNPLAKHSNTIRTTWRKTAIMFFYHYRVVQKNGATLHVPKYLENYLSDY